jgi:DNA polymerase
MWHTGRDEAFVVNTVKCRPPGNRNPTTQEMDACKPFLDEQIEMMSPHLIVGLGKVACQRLLGREVKITKEHGHLDFRDDGRAVMICYHPAYVLRNRRPEIVESFYEAIKTAREIAYGHPNAELHSGRAG